MKKLFLLILLTSLVLASAAAQAQPSQAQLVVAELSFSYTRLSGMASNQFAAWVEDAQGNFVKTLFVTRWTANGGWEKRETSIPMWVRKAGVSNLSKTQIDAVSGATPRTGEITYKWDGTNANGAAVPNGDYVIVLEGTLRWGNLVYYRAPISLGQGASTPQVSVEYVRLPGETRDAEKDRAMFANVKVRTLR